MSSGVTLSAGAEPLQKKPSFWTPFNVISLPIMAAGLIILVIRFTQGLGSVTNLNQEFPWGFWIGFDVVTGVAFAGGAYVITFTVYVMRSRKYMPIVRVTVLNGLLAYIFYAGALVLDLGRPWNIINPIIGNDFGYNSVLFLVAWHFLLYMAAEFIEFSPVVAEWLGWRRARKILHSLTLAAVIFGVTLSTLHQSGLGALFLLAKAKIHPLWYSEFIPILFFVSSIFAGLAMIIVEGTISHRVLRDRVKMGNFDFEEIIFGLAKGAAIAMFAYYFFKLLVFLHEGHWEYLGESWGYLYLLEVGGLTLVPCILFAFGVRNRRIGIVRFAAVLTLLGVLLNRMNVSIIAFNWYVPNHYYPSWMEIVVTLMIICAEIWVFRWIVTRMPVYERSAPGPDETEAERL